VVDADAAGVSHGRSQHVAEGGISRRHQPIGAQRWLRPVLTLMRVEVRRRADGDTDGQAVPQRPAVRAARIDPDGEVVDDTDGHADVARCLLRRGELLVTEPLHPPVVVDPVGVLQPGVADSCTTRVVQRRGPVLPLPAVDLAERAERREVVERLPDPLRYAA
jgi:hypothetical protein